MQGHVLEVAEYWNPLALTIALFVTVTSISILVCYWTNRKNAASGRTDRHKSPARSIDGGTNEMNFLYCPQGCQGACACPKLDGWAVDDPPASSPQDKQRQRVHFLIGKIVLYPEHLRQMLEDDEDLADIVEEKLDALFKEQEKAALSNSSSLVCRLASKEVNEAPLRRISEGLSINYESLGDSGTAFMDTNQEYRHVRRRTFRKIMSSGPAGKCRERCGTI